MISQLGTCSKVYLVNVDIGSLLLASEGAKPTHLVVL
jgi:hypothetical protein